MKQTLLFLIAVFYMTSAYADCTGSGLSLFPSGPRISQNSIFILDGYAGSQDVILGLNTKYSIYLKSGQKKIKLLVTETCVGDFFLTQAVLKPETQLEAGLEYTIHIDSVTGFAGFRKYNRKTRVYETVTYKVLAEKDLVKPQLISAPKELKKTLVHYGCGPSIHVVFSNPVKDESDIVVRTTVKNLKTGKETAYYL